MLIECQGCAVAGAGCGQCVVAELLRGPLPAPEPIAWEPTERELAEWDLDAGERRVLHVLATAGLLTAAAAPAVPTRRERAS